MSPASKSKTKDKKTTKEPQKASSKSSGLASLGSGIPASGYNPLLGTFHTLETAAAFSALPHVNGRFRNIDETDEHVGNSLGAGVEYDSVSNNGSWSGESEDHKDKVPNLSARQETVPGADIEKREKIRQKNERKHQRQKERRAQELHERCCGYLMSRKLEALAQQLVQMGFTQERSTMALILNEGRVDQSINWLCEGCEDANKLGDQNIGSANLKIDVIEEFSKMADMEIMYGCSKQEVERAVVSAEGDLEKAAEALKTLKQDLPSGPKPEETGDPPAGTNLKPLASASPSTVRPQAKFGPFSTTQQRRDDKDINYAKTSIASGPLDSGNKNLDTLKRSSPKLEWAKPQQTFMPADKRGSSTASNPAASYSLASSLQVPAPPANTETRYMKVGKEFKSHQPGFVREPVTVMQRPQSVSTKQVPITNPNWYPSSSVEIMRSTGLLESFPSTRSYNGLNNPNVNQMYSQHQQQQQQHFLPVTTPGEPLGSSRGNGLWSRASASPTLAVASSLGLFSGSGSTGSSGASSPVDWSTGVSSGQWDYTSIDWSFDRGLVSPKPDGMWLGLASFLNNSHMHDQNRTRLGVKPATKSVPANGSASMTELQDGPITSTETSGSREWTSPFEAKDLFSLPRQFVSSPSL